MDNDITTGLFGTCGKTSWRNQFIKIYDKKGINYFDPQVENWTPDCADVEAGHLAKDQIILFPVTSETYGLGSLAEVGFSILNAIKLDDQRDFVILIDRLLDSKLDDVNLKKESIRARTLILNHLKELNLSNIYIVDTIDDMLKVSLVLYDVAVTKIQIEKYSLKNFKMQPPKKVFGKCISCGADIFEPNLKVCDKCASEFKF